MKKLLRARTFRSIGLIALAVGCFFNTAFGQVPANDNCASPTVLLSRPSCVNTAGNLRSGSPATSTAGINTFCGNASSPDVWYSFVAQSAYPEIRLSSIGSNLDNSPRLQLFGTTSCVAATLNANSLACVSGTNVTSLTLNTAVTPGGAGLTIGATYKIRVYTNGASVAAGTAATWAFNICIVDPPPANDDCGNAILLGSGTTCTNTAGTIYASTNDVSEPVAPCTGPVIYDVWYRFIAQTEEPVITLSSIGTAITSPMMQLFSGACGTLVTEACGTNSLPASNLVPGTQYYIRVYSSTGTAPTSNANTNFNICIVDPVPPVPFNDECANAISMPPLGAGCANVLGTMAGATPSAVPIAPCTAPVVYDVWYKFIAVETAANITLSGAANDFGGRRLQLLRGTCGALISVACNTTTIAATGLTVGATYYVRIYSTLAPIPDGNANFTLCVTTPAPPPRFGNSYVNVTKRTIGGVVENGDTLEIRMTINHTFDTLFRPRYVDNIPTNTQMIFAAADSGIRIITNEGLTYKKYSATVNVNNDAATYRDIPPVGHYNIRMNLGFGAFPASAPGNNSETDITGANGRMIASLNRPRGGGGMLFATSFRVVVTGNAGDTIRLGAGKFIYRNSLSGPDIQLVATPYQILISDPLSLCSNATGVNNAQESGGTFGAGTSLNRSNDLIFPIPGYTFTNNISGANGLNDGRYAIVKNISPRSGTNRLADRTPTCPAALPSMDACAQRMHGGHWDVDGDHSGTNDATGNLPPTFNSSGGYMLMVNADYVASETYRQTIRNLCPNTYYEFSAWFRNICPTCGMDSTGSSYTPRRPGVLPNLTFSLDNVDRYSTGEVPADGWVKKGFVFITGPTQDSAIFSIRNNSQGGGGNDWVMDDITVATCLPNMNYSPSLNPTVCRGNSLTINDTIRSFFDNYTHYKWQRSTNGGASWTDVTTPQTAPVGQEHQYITSYTIPPGNTGMADSADLYRVIVGTTLSNLSNPSCMVTDGISIITLRVEDCGIPLKTDLLSFNGKLVSDRGNLFWTTSKEDVPVTFTVERSSDGSSFTRIGSVLSHSNYAAETNSYSFIDPSPVTGKVFYRLILQEPSGSSKYSRIIQLETSAQPFSLSNVINPFYNTLEFDIAVQNDSKIEVDLVDMFGKVVQKNTYLVRTGTNALSLPNTATLPAGTYILRIRNHETLINKKVLKKNF